MNRSQELQTADSPESRGLFGKDQKLVMELFQTNPFYHFSLQPDEIVTKPLAESVPLRQRTQLEQQTLTWLEQSESPDRNWFAQNNAHNLWKTWCEQGPLAEPTPYPLDQRLVDAGLHYLIDPDTGDLFNLVQLAPDPARPLSLLVLPHKPLIIDLAIQKRARNIYTSREMIPAFRTVDTIQTHNTQVFTQDTVTKEWSQISPPTLIPWNIATNQLAKEDLLWLVTAAYHTMNDMETSFNPIVFSGAPVRGELYKDYQYGEQKRSRFKEIFDDNTGHVYSKEELRMGEEMGHSNTYRVGTRVKQPVTIDTMLRFYKKTAPLNLLSWMAVADIAPGTELKDLGMWHPDHDAPVTFGQALETALWKSDALLRRNLEEVSSAAITIARRHFNTIVRNYRTPPELDSQYFGVALNVMTAWPAALEEAHRIFFADPVKQFLKTGKPLGDFIVDAQVRLPVAL